MIYDEPRILTGGDRYVLVEFGNELTLDLNFMAQGLAAAIAEAGLAGVIETAPCYASLLVHYDPERIRHGDLVREVKRLTASLGPLEDIELDSRLIYVEALYLDPWTKACIDDYAAKIAPKEYDPAYVARLNGLADEHELVRVHAGTEYWVAAIGFWPGIPFLMALDPRSVISTPKYNPPRTWTPAGAIGMGGISSTIYGVETPGGYQLFGRTAVPIWDPAHRFADAFEGGLVLLRPGDRLKFVTVDRARHDEVEARVADGSYLHNIVGYQRFSVRNYKAWAASLDRTRRF
ncbi:MAG: allophanate hydrolase subunit 1 [Hyphomicrobium sp.]|uniref:5-oxoprolinase subunit B family protein n=1 Tax=Hyphomicrobium sp. TaxID=82 RepID=UPI003D0A99D6